MYCAEIIAFAVEEAKQMSDYNNVAIKASFADRTKDLTHNADGYHFDRNEANNYE